MSGADLVIRGDIVTPERVITDGYVVVSGETIEAIGGGAPPSAAETQDFRGCWIIPGVIDGQTHAASQLNQEGLGWASKAAAAGGVTVMVDMPYDDPKAISTRDEFERKADEVKRDCHVDVALHATIGEEDGTKEIPGLIDAGAAAFKFSTFEAAPGRFPRIMEDDLEKAFKLIGEAGLACGVHNQMQEMTRRNIARMTEAGDTGWDAFARAHTPLIEDLATAIVYELGARTGARAHVVHCSTNRGFEICAMYRTVGHAASIETCVQYLMLNHEEHAEKLGARIKHYPPIRPKAETELLWKHIAAGNCTFVSSDHVSWGLNRKENPNIFRNTSGGPGLETLLPAFWTGCEEHGIGPRMAVKMLCDGPADHFLIGDRKGRLTPGHHADLAVLKKEKYAFDPSKSVSAVTWSSFEGRQFNVKVAATYCRGELVWDGAKIKNNAGGDGRFVRPTLPKAG
jgi:allantoinase